MIPKVIHYCWFGGNPLPEAAQRCIASWKKWLPDYEIRQWDESNYNVNKIAYTAQAYERKKWAFVSDYARFDILYREGGLYFDTDVEVIRPLDDIIERGPFMGMEKNLANPGLGLGVSPGLDLYREILDYYSGLQFVDAEGKQIPGTVVKHTTDVLKRHGLRDESCIQQVAGVWIYPNDYFNPLDDATGRLYVTPNTRSIHWYSKTWVSVPPLYTKITRLCHRLFGTGSLRWLKHLLGMK